MTDYTPNTDPDPLNHPHGEVIPEGRVKQGGRGVHILLVLGASLFLVLVAFSSIYLLHSHQARDDTPAAAARMVGTPTGG